VVKSFILYCPHLNRDIRGILAKVPNPQIITGYPTVPGEAGCLEMHKEAVRRAKMNGSFMVSVFEDDCKFTEYFDFALWNATGIWAEQNGYNVVQGGSVLTHNPRLVQHGKIAVDRACSAHCMIYLESAYDAILQAEQPFDLSIADKGAKPILVWPFVAIQGKGLSGIGRPLESGASKTYAGPQEVDYEGMFKMHESYLAQSLGISMVSR
jgi:hypothetical protein